MAMWRGVLESRADELIESVVNKALEGDMVAMKVCMDRIIPALRSESRPVKDFTLPAGPAKEQIAALAEGIIDGRVPNETGATVGGMLLRAEQQQADTGSSYEDELKRLIADEDKPSE